MTAQEYLSLYGDYIREEQALQRKLAAWREKAACPSSVSLAEYLGSRGMKRDLSDYVAKQEALAARHLEVVDTLLSVRQGCQQLIFAMDDGAEKTVLYRRYLLLNKWDQVAAALDMTKRQCLRIHESALQHFTEIYGDYLATLK